MLQAQIGASSSKLGADSFEVATRNELAEILEDVARVLSKNVTITSSHDSHNASKRFASANGFVKFFEAVTDQFNQISKATVTKPSDFWTHSAAASFVFLTIVVLCGRNLRILPNCMCCCTRAVKAVRAVTRQSGRSAGHLSMVEDRNASCHATSGRTPRWFPNGKLRLEPPAPTNASHASCSRPPLTTGCPP